MAEKAKWSASIEEELTSSRREIRALRRELGKRLETAAEATTLREEFEREREQATAQLDELERALAESKQQVTRAEGERDALAEGVARLQGIEEATGRETTDRLSELVARLRSLESRADADTVSEELEALAGKIQSLTAAAARVNAIERDRTLVEHRLFHLGTMVESGAQQAAEMEGRLAGLLRSIHDELDSRREGPALRAPVEVEALSARVSQGLAQAEELARQAAELRMRLEDEQIGSS
jgi:chromosome segregation ATPase